MNNFDLKKYLTEGTLLQEGPADDLELKSIAKKLFPILKKYKMKVEYVTDDVEFKATPKVDKHGVPAKLLIKDGMLQIAVYWLSLAASVNELDMEPGGGPSDEQRKNAKIQANKMYKELKAELIKQGVGDEFEMAKSSGMNQYGWYVIQVRKKVVSEGKLLKENQMMGKYIETKHPDGYDMIMSFSMPDEEELGLDYGTLDEILEVKEIDGVKVYCVYI
jgi:hypothetical protein|tara:strand:- start:88 stop:744 length:657 start_codon:yes stop_codon:yes gene_type:complete